MDEELEHVHRARTHIRFEAGGYDGAPDAAKNRIAQQAAAVAFFVLSLAAASGVGLVIGIAAKQSPSPTPAPAPAPPSGGGGGNEDAAVAALRHECEQCESDYSAYKTQADGVLEESHAAMAKYFAQAARSQTRRLECEAKLNDFSSQGVQLSEGAFALGGIAWSALTSKNREDLETRLAHQIAPSVHLETYLDVKKSGVGNDQGKVTVEQKDDSSIEVRMLLNMKKTPWDNVHKDFWSQDFDMKMRHTAVQALLDGAGRPAPALIGGDPHAVYVHGKSLLLMESTCKTTDAGRCPGNGTDGSELLVLDDHCPNLCGQTQTCDAALGATPTCADAGWAPKPDLASIDCFTEKCAQAQCCNPTCSVITCDRRDGWLPKPVPDDCGDRPCTVAQCCHKAGQCHQTPPTCSSNEVLKEAVLDEWCEGVTCRSDECCVPAADCCDHDCSRTDAGIPKPGKTRKIATVIEHCNSTVCKRDQCCEDASTCEKFQCSYPNISIPINHRKTYCDGPYCRVEECCEVGPEDKSCCCKDGYCTDQERRKFPLVQDALDDTDHREPFCCNLQKECDTEGIFSSGNGFIHKQVKNVCRRGIGCGTQFEKLCLEHEGWRPRADGGVADCGDRFCAREQCCEPAPRCDDLCTGYPCTPPYWPRKSSDVLYCKPSCDSGTCCTK